jgi:DNA-binding CsgD family transcriptional regulator
VHPFHPDAIETLVGLGDLDEAAALQVELQEYGERLDRPWGLATAARCSALILSANGAIGGALDAVEQALSHHGHVEWPLEHARTLIVAGELLRRAGRRRDAAARLEDAATILARLRNPLWLARCAAERRRLGGRQSSGELTPAETHVAVLAAAGLRNTEIAARLFVTPKTVEATLTRVYRKVGVRSRTELARSLPRMDDDLGRGFPADGL